MLRYSSDCGKIPTLTARHLPLLEFQCVSRNLRRNLVAHDLIAVNHSAKMVHFSFRKWLN
jgi:hypothetical protein